ncbi:MAG: hypothetical protein M3Q29_22570 [Chloroflexota bacterium]|nr:hypothetical protein [Chloroflexota bacterium]
MTRAFERVYDEFGEGLRGFVLRRVGDPHAAEDIVQDVYLKIHARVDTLRDKKKVGARVYTVARSSRRS